MKPSDFYFTIFDDEEMSPVSGFVVLVAYKDTWDKEGYIDDCIEDMYDVMPVNFVDIMECHYEYKEGEGTREEARQELLDAGFI